MEKNPFNLKERKAGGPSRTHTARTWTEDEIKEKLTGYFEVPDKYWHKVAYGTHVRYSTKEDGYKPGGFVVKNPFDTKPQGTSNEKRFIKLQNNFDLKGKDHVSWIIAYEDLDKLYIKADVSALMLTEMVQGTVEALNENTRKLRARTDLLESRISTLERRNTK